MKAKTQRTLRFPLAPKPDELKVNHGIRQKIFNEFREPSHFHPSELLAQLLKRLSRSVMDDVTTCSPLQLAAHVQRLRDLCEVIDHATRHKLIPEHECVLSGLQLAHPSSVLDFRACLDHTKEYHRAPLLTNYHDEVLNRLDLIYASIVRANFSTHSAPSESSSVATEDDGGGL